MKIRRFATPVILLLAALTAGPAQAQDSEPTYDLNFDWKPVVGWQIEVEIEKVEKTDVEILVGGQPTHQDRQRNQVAGRATSKIVRVEGDESAEEHWTFQKAVRVEAGEEKPTVFQGKTVVVLRQDHGGVEFQWPDGTAIIGDADLELLEKLTDHDRVKDEGPDGDEVIRPDHPVRVGETWHPDLKLLTQAMFGGSGTDVGELVDLAASSAAFTLVSAERRDGAQWGTVEGVLELKLRKLGTLPLEETLPCRIEFRMEGCIDGTQPDSVQAMKLSMRGRSKVSSPPAPPDGEMVLKLTQAMEVKRVRRTLMGAGSAH